MFFGDERVINWPDVRCFIIYDAYTFHENRRLEREGEWMIGYAESRYSSFSSKKASKRESNGIGGSQRVNDGSRE
jgi:hypothetical protein